MDPITGALIAAIAAGATAGATEVGKSALVDAYNSVKALIKRKFEKTDLPLAIENLEKKPESKSRQGMVQEEIVSANADEDNEILKAIQMLRVAIHQTRKVEHNGDDIHIQAKGDVVFAKDSGKAIQVKNSKVGVVGDNAKINGGIHFKNQK